MQLQMQSEKKQSIQYSTPFYKGFNTINECKA